MNMFKAYDRPHGSHQFSITKIITYDDHEQLKYYSNLYSLLKEDTDFGDIKVPKFDFEVNDTDLIVKSEYIKGRQWQADDFWLNYDLIANNLVMRENDYSFKDYDPTNFIAETNTNQIYYVDFEGYDKCTIQERAELLKQTGKIALESVEPGLRTHIFKSRFKLL